MHFEFATSARIVFGERESRLATAIAAQWGGRALVVTGSRPQRVEGLTANVSHTVLALTGEPTVEAVRAGVLQARVEDCRMVIAIGGGSAMDAGKAIAAMLTNPGDPMDYLEVVGGGRQLEQPPAPFLAIPTTAGSGAEVTRNAVLASTEHRVKASMRSPLLLPKVAIVDPELTLGLPPAVTASTGLDALTQLIEPYVSLRANAFTDLYCVEGLRKVSACLERAYHHGEDRQARCAMSWASLLGGLSLANAGLGVVHAFAAPIGGQWNAPHGAVCAAVAPHAVAVNVEALRRRAPTSQALRRYDEIARIVTRQPHAIADDAVLWISELCDRLAIPPLRAYGITPGDVDELCAKVAQTSSMKGNPIELTGEELREIAVNAL